MVLSVSDLVLEPGSKKREKKKMIAETVLSVEERRKRKKIYCYGDVCGDHREEVLVRTLLVFCLVSMKT